MHQIIHIWNSIIHMHKTVHNRHVSKLIIKLDKMLMGSVPTIDQWPDVNEWTNQLINWPHVFPDIQPTA